MAELAYTPTRLRLEGAVTADHRTDVAKLIHALVGVKLVLVASAFHFVAILRYLLVLTISESHSCFYFLLLIIENFMISRLYKWQLSNQNVALNYGGQAWIYSSFLKLFKLSFYQ